MGSVGRYEHICPERHENVAIKAMFLSGSRINNVQLFDMLHAIFRKKLYSGQVRINKWSHQTLQI